MWAVQKVCDVIFFPRKLMKRGRCAVVGRWRVPSCAYMDFFPPADSVSCVQPVCDPRMYMQRTSHCYFLRKWWNDSSSGIASNSARSLAIAKWKPFRRFSGFSVTMPWASHKLRSGTTDSKMAARQWRATLVPVGPQQAKMTSSLTKCRLCSAGPSCHCPRTCGGGGDKHWFGTFHFDQWFGPAESVREIRAEAANDGAEATPSESRAGHAGLHKQWSRIRECCDHWWWVVGLQVHPGNQGTVITVETCNISETINGHANAEQHQSDVDHFLWLPWGGASRVCTTRSKY